MDHARQSYYDEAVETMARSDIARLQEQQLIRLAPHVYEHGALVREAWDRVSLKPQDIRSLDDFREKVPVIDKAAMVAYRERTGDPYGGLKCLGQPRHRSTGFTSGTTGDPTAIAFSDQIASNRGLRRDFWQIGMRPGDYFIYNILTIRRGQESDRFAEVDFRPICLGHDPAETPRMLDAFQIFRPKVLHHLSRPLVDALEQVDRRGDVDLKEVFQSCLGAPAGGEPPSPRIVELLARWGLEMYDFTSLGDVCSAMECRQHDGMHAWEDLAFVECLDPTTLEPVPEGTPGELVVTSLQDEVAPLVRYRAGDLITYTSARCGCGRTHGRIKVLGRAGDQVVVNGKSIMPRDVMPVIDQVPEVINGVFQILRPRRDLDVLRVRVGVADDAPPGLEERIAGRLTEYLGVPAAAETVPISELRKLGPPHKMPRVTPS